MHRLCRYNVVCYAMKTGDSGVAEVAGSERKIRRSDGTLEENLQNKRPKIAGRF